MAYYFSGSKFRHHNIQARLLLATMNSFLLLILTAFI